MMKSAKDSHTKKTIVRKNSPKVIFKITRQRKEHINNLADHLSFIAPSTTFGEHSFSIENLAKEWRLSKYFKKQRNKKNDISYFLSNVLRYRKNTPKQLVMEIVKRGMQWKANQGETVQESLLSEIAKEMAALGFPIEKELSALEHPNPSQLCPPSVAMINAFKALPFYQSVLQDDIFNLFSSGQYNEAVRKSFERFEKLVQDIHAAPKLEYGKDLMAKAFSENNPSIKITPCSTQDEINIQQGIKFMAMGVMMSVRNPTTHGDRKQMNVGEAIELIGLASYLCKLVDRRLV
ncbi:TIGR02391 family protein [uncultured Sphaerochaeta sp.]|uniref:TIGR02391 family protein n=1 Tax=uncultured Sphaerochaeta sp. TaxID=886478 RepID=UPI0029C9E42B|nr:TIGR02391 family protein [uncultured Sphaerochaeta sp.]